MIGQPDNHCSFSLFCGYSDKKKTPYLWVLSCLYLILFKNRPIVPDATLDQVDPLVFFKATQTRKLGIGEGLGGDTKGIERKSI